MMKAARVTNWNQGGCIGNVTSASAVYDAIQHNEIGIFYFNHSKHYLSTNKDVSGIISGRGNPPPSGSGADGLAS